MFACAQDRQLLANTDEEVKRIVIRKAVLWCLDPHRVNTAAQERKHELHLLRSTFLHRDGPPGHLFVIHENRHRRIQRRTGTKQADRHLTGNLRRNQLGLQLNIHSCDILGFRRAKERDKTGGVVLDFSGIPRIFSCSGLHAGSTHGVGGIRSFFETAPGKHLVIGDDMQLTFTTARILLHGIQSCHSGGAQTG